MMHNAWGGGRGCGRKEGERQKDQETDGMGWEVGDGGEATYSFVVFQRYLLHATENNPQIIFPMSDGHTEDMSVLHKYTSQIMGKQNTKSYQINCGVRDCALHGLYNSSQSNQVSISNREWSRT